MKTTLSRKEQDEVVAQYQRGMKTDAIAAQFNVDVSYPGKLARKRGIPARQRGRLKIKPEIQAAIYADYCEGFLSLRQISQKYNVSESYPSRLSRKLNGPLRYKKQVKTNRTHVPKKGKTQR